MSCSTYLKFLFQSICTNYANFDKKNHIKVFYSVTIDLNGTKVEWNCHWVVHFQNCVHQTLGGYELCVRLDMYYNQDGCFTKNRHFFN